MDVNKTMKRKKRTELHTKSVVELNQLVLSLRRDHALAVLKGRDEKNTDRTRQIRHDIARALTILKGRQLQNSNPKSTIQPKTK